MGQRLDLMMAYYIPVTVTKHPHTLAFHPHVGCLQAIGNSRHGSRKWKMEKQILMHTYIRVKPLINDHL